MYELRRFLNDLRKGSHKRGGFVKVSAKNVESADTVNHLTGNQKIAGKVVFFIIKKTNNGFRIRLNGKEFTLQTKQNLLTNRTYIGEIIKKTGDVIVMSTNFIPVDNPEGLSSLLRDFPARLIALLLRNNIGLKARELDMLKSVFTRKDRKLEEEDPIVDIMQKHLPVDGVLEYLTGKYNQEKRDKRENNPNESKEEYSDISDVIKASILRKKGYKTPLLLYNHIHSGNGYHWVHIPVRLQTNAKTIDGYVRLQFSIESKRFIKAILHMNSQKEDELVCEINTCSGGYTLAGDLPASISDKSLGSGKKIVDIFKRSKDVFSGMNFTTENEIKGVDVDV